jgi:hypothetical protein
MAFLNFTCPETRQQAPTGIGMDAASLRAAWSKKINVECPCCGKTHKILVRQTYVDSALSDASSLGPITSWGR